MFISIYTTSSHKGNLAVERIGNTVTQFSSMLCWDFRSALAITVMKKHVPRVHLVIYTFKPFGKYANLFSFKEINTFNSFFCCCCCCYFFFVHNILCIPRKDDWWMRNVHKICSALNLTVICFKPFDCDNTTFSISVSFLNETYFSIN